MLYNVLEIIGVGKEFIVNGEFSIILQIASCINDYYIYKPTTAHHKAQCRGC